MSNENFDIKALHNRIAELKEESERSVDFTYEFIECLIKRHDLAQIIHDEHEFEDVPEEVTNLLKKGEIPSKEMISTMDIDTQDYLIKDLVWICGMGAIAWYSENDKEYEDMNPTPFDEIIEMPNVSVGHHSASYIIAALALLMARIPSSKMIEAITNNFDNSEEQLYNNAFYYSDLCFSILRRYQEDIDYLKSNEQ